MRPIAALTASAREITATRDPSKRIPEPESDDEIAELARTLAQMLRALDEANDEREQALQRQREFVADASHELRTPLTSVLANLELLDEELDRDDSRKPPNWSAPPSAPRNGCAGSSRTSCCSPAPMPAIGGAHADRPRRDRHLRAERGQAVANGHPLEANIDGPLPIEGERRRPPSPRRQPPRQRRPAHAAGREGRARRQAPRRRTRALGLGRGPGLPEGKEDLLFERFVRGEGPPTSPATAARGSAWRSSRLSPTLTAAASAPGVRLEAGRCSRSRSLRQPEVPLYGRLRGGDSL